MTLTSARQAAAAPAVVSAPQAAAAPLAAQDAGGTAFVVLFALSACHLLNDTIQSLLPAIYPVLEESYHLTYAQIGFLHFAFQVTASLLQPLFGHFTDKRPMFRLTALGMGASLVGLALLAYAHQYWLLLVAAMTIGLGSAIFHPDSARVARAASGGRYGLAQSVFQVGGNTGTAIGPLLAAYVVVPFGQSSLAWFTALALLAMVILWYVGTWARAHHLAAAKRAGAAAGVPAVPHRTVALTLTILAILVFSKFAYVVCLSSYYTFYVIEEFGVSVTTSQLLLFVFLFASAVGTFVGGPIGDWIGRKAVIWVSILGALPFALLLPHVGLVWCAILSGVVGFIMASAFSAILVYAQALLPGRVGMVSGLFFGFAFGIAGVAAALLGALADATSIRFVFLVCSFLPAVGLLTAFIPPDRKLAGA